MHSKSRRTSLVRVISAVVCLCVGTVAFASMASWWHGLTQSQRDSAILSRARQDRNRDVNMECKEWVRRVVMDASRGEMTIPSTKSNNYQWNNASYITDYPATQCPPRGAESGRIIQMVWRNQDGRTTPHTAIISSMDSNGMNWIDANWQGDQIVRTHYVTYDTFNQAVGTKYTVYKIR